jgi:hypothetical protein
MTKAAMTAAAPIAFISSSMLFPSAREYGAESSRQCILGRDDRMKTLHAGKPSAGAMSAAAK